MKKIDKTVLKETKYIGACVLLLSALMQAVFLIFGQWDYTVLLGNLLGGVSAVLNFFFLGLTVQSAVNTEDERYTKQLMRLSQALRLFLTFVIILVGVVLPYFNTLATLIPVFFPRIAITLSPLFNSGMVSGDAPKETDRNEQG